MPQVKDGIGVRLIPPGTPANPTPANELWVEKGNQFLKVKVIVLYHRWQIQNLQLGKKVRHLQLKLSKDMI